MMGVPSGRVTSAWATRVRSRRRSRALLSDRQIGEGSRFPVAGQRRLAPGRPVDAGQATLELLDQIGLADRHRWTTHAQIAAPALPDLLQQPVRTADAADPRQLRSSRIADDQRWGQIDDGGLEGTRIDLEAGKVRVIGALHGILEQTMHVPDEVAQGFALRHAPEDHPHLRAAGGQREELAQLGVAQGTGGEDGHASALCRRSPLAFHPAPPASLNAERRLRIRGLAVALTSPRPRPAGPVSQAGRGAISARSCIRTA